jgi:hypothetical protein
MLACRRFWLVDCGCEWRHLAGRRLSALAGLAEGESGSLGDARVRLALELTAGAIKITR